MQVLIWNWWNAHGLLRKREGGKKRKEKKGEEHIHTRHHEPVESKFPWCAASQQELLSFALRASEQTQNAEDVFDTMLFRCQQEVQAACNRHTPLFLRIKLVR